MKCFYHADHDGHCAAYWVHKRYPVMTREDFIEINYGYNFQNEVIDRIHKDEDIIIVDFSFLPEEMEKILSITEKVTWIDHHITAINKYKDFNHEIKGIRYDGIAGCMLTYIYYHQMNFETEFDPKLADKAPWMTKFISDYDVWKYEFGKETTYFILGLDMVEDTHPFARIWEDLINLYNFVINLINNGKIIEQYKNTESRKSLPRGFEFDLNGHKIFCENNLKGDSTNFLEKMQEYDACLQFYYDGECWNYSLYSEKIDCTQVKICDTQFEGHKGASGCHSKYLFTEYKQPNELMNNIINRLDGEII